MNQSESNNKLNFNEKSYQKLIENLSIAIVIHGADSRVIYANDAALKILGLTLEQIQGKISTDPNWMFIHEDGTPVSIEDLPVSKVISSGKEVKSQIMGMNHPLPRMPTWVICNAHPEFDEQGNITEVIVNFTDITAHKNTEIKSKKSLSFLEQISKSVPGVIYQFQLRKDGTSCFPYASEAIQQIYQVTPEEVRKDAKKVFSIIHPDDIDAVSKSINKSAAELSTWSHEYRVKYIDGTTRWLMGNSQPQKMEDGSILWHGFITDITQKKYIENELSDSLKFSKLLINSMQDGFSLLDKFGTTIDVNLAFCSMTGFSREDLIGVSTPHPYWPPEEYENIKKAFDKTIQNHQNYSFELIFMRKNGERFPVIVTPSAVKNSNGEVVNYLATIKDITERKISELKLIKAKEEAEKAAIIKSNFLDSAAHELRTPVTAFSILLHLTEKKLQKGVPVDGSILSRLRSQAERLSNLVIDLLDVSRLERGKISLNREMNDISKLIHECVDDIKLKAPTRNFIFIKPIESIMINIDSVRIYQVITNLLNNARKYTPEESPIEVILEKNANTLRVSILDHGHGISKEDQLNLFTPFTRGVPELKERSGGLGLGLYISRSIVELHGGKIGVDSQLGSGSTFHFELPLEVNES